MKRILLILFLLITATALSFAEKKNNTIVVDEKQYSFKGNCELYKSVSFATADFVSKSMGIQITVDKDNITLVKDDIKVNAKVGNSVYTRNDEKIPLKEPVYKKNGQIFLPLKAISYFFNYEVSASFKKDYSIEVKIEKSSKTNLWTTLETIPKDARLKFSYDNNWAVWYETNDEGSFDKKGNPNPSPTYVVVFLKNLTTGEIKEIYSSEKASFVGYLFWTKDNTLIMTAYKDIYGKKNREHTMLYNPKTQKFTHLFDMKKKPKTFVHFVYSEEKNALAYALVFTDDGTVIPNKTEYRIFYLDTKKEEPISEKLYDTIEEIESQKQKNNENN